MKIKIRDYNGNIKAIKEYNKDRTEVHYKDLNTGFEWWKNFNEDGLMIRYRDSYGIDKTYKRD